MPRMHKVNGMKVLVTGIAGFIGNEVALRLLSRGDTVIGVDNLNPYYDPQLKRDRMNRLKGDVAFYEKNIADKEAMLAIFKEHRPDRVVHLAAQAGVRYSLTHPDVYVESNLVGHLNLLEACRNFPVEHMVYASSSSVYGGNGKLPFSVHDNVDHPLSLYAATKKADELMSHCYSSLYQIPTTGLRFFTVYGPWGRPDMALFTFTEKILAGEPIEVFNYGNHRRDFTYIDDIVEGVLRVLDKAPSSQSNWDRIEADPGSSFAPYRIYNIGNSSPVVLGEFIDALEKALGKKAERRLMPMAAGDVAETFADIADLERDFGYRPKTTVVEGIQKFVDWYLTWKKVA